MPQHTLCLLMVTVMRCSHGPVLAKQGRSRPSSSPRSRAASRAPILTAAAAFDFVVLTNHMIAGRLPHEQPASGTRGSGLSQLKNQMAAVLLVAQWNPCLASRGGPRRLARRIHR